VKAVSQWAQANPGAIQTGSADVDGLIQILLSVGMFVAGFVGFVLDNTISGTDDERGFTKRHEAERAAEICRDPTYDFPVGMGLIKKLATMQLIQHYPSLFNLQIKRWLPFSFVFPELKFSSGCPYLLHMKNIF